MNVELLTGDIDSRGRQIRQTDRIGGVNQFAYYADGKLSGLIGTEDQVASYTYDAANNKLTETYPGNVRGSQIGDAGFDQIGVQKSEFSANHSVYRY